MTREGRKFRTYDPCAGYAKRGIAPFLSILCNNVRITGTDTESAPPFFIIRTLVERGGVAYWRGAGIWAAYREEGPLKRNGLPSRVRLIGELGKVSEPFDIQDGKEADVCVIPANAYFFPPWLSILEKVDTLQWTGDAMRQNVDALKQCMAIVYDDPLLKADVERAERQRIAGASTVSFLRNTGRTVETVNFSPNAQSHVAEFLALWTQTMEELDELTGRIRIGEKQERRTDDEIEAIEQGAGASVNTLVETFNRYAEWYGINASAEWALKSAYKARKAQDEESIDSARNQSESGQKISEEGDNGNA